MKTVHFKGFTLIELLVVIAVIGVLAGAIIVAVNPVEQLARSRDAGRKSSTQQLANAVSAYYASTAGSYPASATTWINVLQSAGEIRSIPAAVTGGAGYTNCTQNVSNGYCYGPQTADYMVFSKMESTAESSKCPTAPNTVAYYLFSSAQARSGIVCAGTTNPTWSTSFTFL